MPRAIMKILRQGNSAMVTLPRAFCFALELVPGDFIELKTNDDGSATFRRWATEENQTRQSPGVIPARPDLSKA